MTPEEKAAMDAAAEAEAKGEDPQAAAEKVTGTSIHDTPAAAAGDGAAASSATGAASATTGSATAPVEPGTSLAHHSSFSSSSSNAASSSSTTKKDGSTAAVPAAAKGKAKLTPEQKAQLDALEKKRDEEKAKR